MIQRDYLLIDTCFLIDSFSHPEVFTDFLQEVEDRDCFLITIPQVKYEFLRSKTKDVVENKKVYFGKTIKSLINTDKVNDQIEPLMIEYGRYLDGVSIVDMYLAAVLKQMRFALLTRNYKDFPTTMFKREEFFNFELINNVLTYSIYSYGPSIKKKEKVDIVPF